MYVIAGVYSVYRCLSVLTGLSILCVEGCTIMSPLCIWGVHISECVLNVRVSILCV